ncbi:hypothetical protein CTI12_AA201570 [Artemisia annua]|uniref:WHEP-TRS domain-containing protein n=1 Tax=Artemisia annua TaxID=35608 RepID=A0A2U1N8Y8_ARTAN|nr:hypothetical protein CTI12_AA201570 [Artemisia annua]
MSTESSLRESLATKLTTINHHGDVIRSLKSSHAPKSEIEEAVKPLKAPELEKAEIESELKAALSGESNGSNSFNGMSRETFRQAVVNTLERRLFYIPSFKIYKGVADEKTGTCYRVDHLLKDHCKDKLEKDLAISSEKAAELKHILAVLDDLSAEQLGAKIKEYGIVAPDTKNPLSDRYPFNLMFATSIGPCMSSGAVAKCYGTELGTK